MTLRRLHDGRDDGLSPLASLDLSDVRSFSGLVRGMGKTAFGGRCLGQALDVFLAMTRDQDCRVVMTITGAMTVAKQGSIICEMIDRGLVDAIVATGALIAHGLTESIGLIHYAADPTVDDRELYTKGYNRIYDTLEMERNLNDVANLLLEVLEREQPPDGVWSSASLCRSIGHRLDELATGPGILRSAWRKNVPVFIPAFTDSELGLDLVIWALRKVLAAQESASQGPDHQRTHRNAQIPATEPKNFDLLSQAVPSFNPYLDLLAYARFAGAAKRLGIFTIGGGVPRNWAQQLGPLFEIMRDRTGCDLSSPRFQYGVRICPEPVHWGGLSGCTYQEGISWGKFVPPNQGGRYAEVLADATLVWPLLMKAVFEELDGEAEA